MILERAGILALFVLRIVEAVVFGTEIGYVIKPNYQLLHKQPTFIEIENPAEGVFRRTCNRAFPKSYKGLR